MEYGGVLQAPITAIGTDGKVRVVKSNKPVVLTAADIKTITSELSAEQIKVADAIGAFFDGPVADWGNAVSERLYGYKKFTVENYFPIVSDKNYIPTAFAAEQNASLKDMGITKSRVAGANNPIVIEDIFDVFTRQVDRMSSYNAFVLPLVDMERVYNHRSREGSVKQSIRNAFGSGANAYIVKLMKDINGKVNTEAEAELMRTLTRNFKAAAVGANIRVVLQQPTSYARAFALIDGKYLLRGLEGVAKVKWKTVEKYAPIAQWKSWGYFTLDTGRPMREVLIGDTPAWSINGIIEKSLWAAGKADEVTWKALWRAVELEIADTKDHLEVGSEAYYEVAGKRFSEIIDRTQVVDSVFHRTAMMRSENDALKMVTSFMSEPMKSYNLLRTAYVEMARNPTAHTKQQFVRSATAWLVSATMNAMVVALFDRRFRRPDDEDELEYW
jgi:hypothetical protein